MGGLLNFEGGGPGEIEEIGFWNELLKPMRFQA